MNVMYSLEGALAPLSSYTDLGVGGGWRVRVHGRAHEQAVLLVDIVVVQQRREGAVDAAVTGDVVVAGGRRRREGRPAAGGRAEGLGLAAHAVGPAAEAAEGDGADDQGELQDQLIAAGDVDVDLEKV